MARCDESSQQGNAASPADPPADEQLLTVSSEASDRALLLTAVGETDMGTVERLRGAICDALANAGRRPVILDLRSLSFIDSHGLHALVEASQQADRDDVPLRLVVDHQRIVLRPLQLSGLDQIFALYDTIDDALADRPLT